MPRNAEVPPQRAADDGEYKPFWLREKTKEMLKYGYPLTMQFPRKSKELADEMRRCMISIYKLTVELDKNPNEPFGLPPGKKPEDVAFESWLYNVGMPIGNLLSQMFANIVLNELDQHCKHVLKLHCYIRYMDDILVLGPDKEQLKQCHAAIAAFLSEMLHLDLNAKTCIRPVSMGIEFVGQRVWATHAVLRKSTARRMKREVRKISEDVRDGVINRQEYQRRVASIRGMMDHTNSAALAA